MSGATSDIRGQGFELRLTGGPTDRIAASWGVSGTEGGLSVWFELEANR